MNALSLSFQKRCSDAPLIRFLPAEDAVPDVAPKRARSGGSSSIHDISHQTYLSLVAGAERQNTTLENLLLAGFASLLARLTRQDVVAISVGEQRLAMFNLEGDCSFREVLRQGEHKTALQISLAEQGVDYEFLTEDVTAPQTTICGLRLVIRKNGSQIELANPTGLWREQTLRAWNEYMLAMLEAAVENPALPVSRLPMWSESAARDFYLELNRTETEFAGELSVPGLFAAQARQRPEAAAVISGARRYTYRELDRRSTELAQYLLAAGAGPNRAVAVCMERSVDLPVALLAVLKSGSYYVPLDPHNPSERLRGILEECAPVAIVSDTAIRETLSGFRGLGDLPLLTVDEPAPSTGTLPALASDIQMRDLAYTIYTSGTTGKPKGVRITHGALLNLICSIWQRPGVSLSDKTLAVAPISFDIATMDMFLPICSGGTLVIASREEAVDPFALADLIQQNDITVLQATPATWRMMLTSGWTGKRDLKMISGGEALPRELANELLRLGGELWNCYGPTETTIYSGVIQLKLEEGIVPVGPPIANTSFYVMDSQGFPVPPGVPGELYIGGRGVSPGYVSRPELTSQRFVPERFGKVQDGYVFCTGDLVRLVKGNEFEFFGRLDHQVKLRGFRIELGEIESVLRTHPSISDAVVILREDIPGEPRLAAYVLCPGSGANSAELRSHAAKSLPEYMLPSVIVKLEQYPLSASGKINRRALPIPESIQTEISAEKPESTGASGELESKLLKIFRDVLRNDTIGVTDSFFKYGGYSLLTVKLFSRIDREMHVRLPISLLFDAPTVRMLARVIAKGVAPSVIVPIRPYGRSAPIFIVQSYLLYSAMLEIVEQDRPVYGVREMGDETEPQAVEERARRYAEEILQVYSDGPIYLAGWCAAGTLTVEIARHLRATGHQVGLVALFDAECPGHTPPKGVGVWTSTMAKKLDFHRRRIQQIPWKARITYILEALGRNWDWAVESFYTANFRSMLWLQKRFGLSLSEAAFNNVYASFAGIQDSCVQPYSGKLNLYRAADVPNFSGMDETLGWRAVAPEVEVSFVPGDHVSMFKKPNVASLAQKLQFEMQKSESKSRRIESA
jgi:amino acid adenylation domain-containing protein